MNVPEAVTDVIGIIGGVLLSLCTIPQLYTMWKHKSAEDVSMLFLITYFIGLALTVAYLVIIQAWAGAGPAIFELSMSVGLIVSKLIIERRYPPTQKGPWIRASIMRFDQRKSIYSNRDSILRDVERAEVISKANAEIEEREKEEIRNSRTGSVAPHEDTTNINLSRILETDE